MKYYVNNHAQSNGDHEVHHENCPYLPSVVSKNYLGDFSSCRDAVDEAKKLTRQRTAVRPARPAATRAKHLYLFSLSDFIMC